MSQILFQYQRVDPTTWVYLSSLLMIGLFFKFNRIWSVRNLDLILLILLAPGLLLVHGGKAKKEEAREKHSRAIKAPANPNPATLLENPVVAPKAKDGEFPATGPNLDSPLVGETPISKNDLVSSVSEPNNAEGTPQKTISVDEEELKMVEVFGRKLEYAGYIWLFSVGGIFLLRLLLDPTMVRRPLLDPNLSTGGLIFIGCSLFLFLMANVVTSKPTQEDLEGPRGAAKLLGRESSEKKNDSLQRHGPGYAVLNLLIPTMFQAKSTEEPNVGYAVTAKIMAIISHLLIVVGIVAIGLQHFENLRMGIGAATLYLMLPYTAQMTGRVDHVLPASLLVWAILMYRRPLVAGILIGLAMGLVYYPLFLLPLWLSFYWQRGVFRFILGVTVTLTLLTLSLIPVSDDPVHFWANVKAMFGLWLPVREGLSGIWNMEIQPGWDPVYRLPVLAGFVALSGTMAIWPAQKNLGTLLSCSAAIMVATQFWHGHGGGQFMAWYLPLALLTIFRPNLEDRIAVTVLNEGWFSRRKAA